MTEPGQPQPYDPPSGSQPYGAPSFPGQGQGPGQGYGQGYGSPPVRSRNNGLGTAALVLGVLALISCWTVLFGLVLGIPAIVLGVIGRRRAARGEADNGGIATAGLVLGIVGLVLSLVVAVAFGSALVRLFNSPEGQRLQECLTAAQGDQARVQACRDEFARNAGS